MSITLRPLDASRDYPQLAALFTAVEPEPITVEQLEARDRTSQQGAICRRMVALDGAGALIGQSLVKREPWQQDGRLFIEATVAPHMRRQGIGAHLYAEALAFVEQQGARVLSTTVRDNSPASLAFAERRGFAVERHTFESTLDLTTFDETPFAHTIAAVEATGLHFLTLADLGNTVEAQRKLYELNRSAGLDQPGSDGTFAPFERFSEFVFNAEWYRPDGQIVVADGDRWAGLAAVGYFAASNMMYNAFTGVHRDYRGRGLALPLKLLAIRCARRYGAAYMRTNNDSQNVRMLAVNRKLGYQPEPGLYGLLREVAS